MSQSHGPVNHTNNNTVSDHVQGPSIQGNQFGTNQQRSQHISIGTWPSGTSTGLSARPAEVQSHFAIARTGTDLSREERDVETSMYEYEPSSDGSTLSSDGSMPPSGVADTRSANADAASSHDPLPADNTGSISHSEEVCRLGWFLVLVVMLLVTICELIGFLLVDQASPYGSGDTYYFGHSFTFQGLALFTAVTCVVIWSAVILYTGFFVFLTEYHKAVGKFLDRYFFLRRRVQPMCLRCFAILYAVCSIVGVGMFYFSCPFLVQT